MRWFTCTPRDYSGGNDFFSRDTGLLCRGLQQIGVDSKAVMTGSQRRDDDPALLRVEMIQLESRDWWEAQKLDGVVLYAWGRPRYRKVAVAIRKAGICLVLHQDSGGIISPLSGIVPWLADQWHLAGTVMRFVKSTLRSVTIGLFATDPLRAAHLRQADHIACVSPMAVERYRRICRIYGGHSLANRVILMPHSVETRFRYQNTLRSNTVVCVGRWCERDSVQKRPDHLMHVLTRLLDSDQEVRVYIVGEASEPLQSWHAALPDRSRLRTTLSGWLNRDELAELLAFSRVFYSPSAYESFGIAAAEALCSGCSVVAVRSISMESFQWFVSENSGTLADDDDVNGHLSALKRELDAWKNGQRNPQQISDIWSANLHADRVAAMIASIKKSGRFSQD